MVRGCFIDYSLHVLFLESVLPLRLMVIVEEVEQSFPRVN